MTLSSPVTAGPFPGGPADLLELPDPDDIVAWKAAGHVARTPLTPPSLRDNQETVFAVFLLARDLGIGPLVLLQAVDIADERLVLSHMAMRQAGYPDDYTAAEAHEQLCRRIMPAWPCEAP